VGSILYYLLSPQELQHELHRETKQLDEEFSADEKALENVGFRFASI
jgi:hypothetical protein